MTETGTTTKKPDRMKGKFVEAELINCIAFLKSVS